MALTALSASVLPRVDWRALLVAALEQVTSTALGASVEPLDDAPPPPTDAGAYVPVLTGAGGLQLGLVAGDAARAALAAALLGAEPSELGPSDVADALAEIANMLAGCAKTLLLAIVPPVTIGLPVVVHGWIEPGERLALVARRVRCLEHDVHPVVIAPRHVV
jgi:hypothetical protein